MLFVSFHTHRGFISTALHDFVSVAHAYWKHQVCLHVVFPLLYAALLCCHCLHTLDGWLLQK
jgi:hypothetical protein